MIETARTLLRPWRDLDREPFAALRQDAAVTATLGPLSIEASNETVDRQMTRQAELGFCFWALERRDDGRFLGWCGLKRGDVGPLAGEIEIGWGLGRDAWGQGYVTEAASAVLDWTFSKLSPPLVFAISARINQRSWQVMERIGMERRPDLDFDHPTLADDDPLRPHITYVMER